MRLAIFVAVALAGTVQTLDAQEVLRIDSWRDGIAQFQGLKGEARVPLPAAGCTRGAPDSLALVSPVPSQLVTPERIFINHHAIQPPERPDTVHLRLTRAGCLGDSPGKRNLAVLIFFEDDVQIIYRLDPPLEPGDTLASVRFIRPDTLTRAIWTGSHLFDTAATDSLAAMERAQRAAEQARRAAEQARLKAAHDSLIARRDSLEAHRAALIRSFGWPKRFADAAIVREVVIGMTSDMVVAAWGKPRRINTTVTAQGRSEQWVYDLSTFVYFTNGRVSTVQTSREN